MGLIIKNLLIAFYEILSFRWDYMELLKLFMNTKILFFTLSCLIFYFDLIFTILKNTLSIKTITMYLDFYKSL